MAKKAYITTTLPYVNSDPHIGFAMEIVRADVWARVKRLNRFDVFFNTGTDEHGLKIYLRAVSEKKDPKVYVDNYTKKFQKLKSILNLDYTAFIRTTNESHKKAAQEFWKICEKNGDIYKKYYEIKYCIGCELEKTESELINGRCPLHSNRELEIIKEENYFFRFSKFQKKLLEFYKKTPGFVIPESRFREIKNFVARGLEDFSISRLKSKLPWGIDVPGDPEHVIYVWFDALINYISSLGWPKNQKKFKEFWPGIQFAGTDNLRQQSAMWQAMLMSAGLQNSKQVVIHGFVTSEGKKMSKSLGNIVDPFVIVKKYGTDAVRYYLLREIPPFDDAAYSDSRMQEVYDSDLANELGNLVLRVTTLAQHDGVRGDLIKKKVDANSWADISNFVGKYKFSEALEYIWIIVKNLNKKINEDAPWKKTKLGRAVLISEQLRELYNVSYLLQPFLPDTAEKIQEAVSSPSIKKAQPLFPKR